VTPRPGTSGNAGCGRSCRRSPVMATRRVLAARDMAAERRCTTALDRTHHLQLGRGSHARGCPHASRTVVRKMSATSRSWSSHGRRRDGAARPALSRVARPAAAAARRPSRGLSDLAISPIATLTLAGCRSLGLGMSEQRLNHANVLAALEADGSQTVAKRMQRDRLAQRRGFGRPP